MSVIHYRAIHKHLFQDVYTWAGNFRSVRIARDGSMFCYPENIAREMSRLFEALRSRSGLRGLSQKDFATALARFLAELNAIHPFRDGNGRKQLAFAALVASQAGYPMNFAKLRPQKFLAAMIKSFRGDEKNLKTHISRLIA